MRPAGQSAVTAAEAVPGRRSAGQSAGISAERSSAGQSAGGVSVARSAAGQSGAAVADVMAGRSPAGQSRAAVRDVFESKPSPKHASQRIRQPAFGGEGTRGVDTAASASSSATAAAVVGFDKNSAGVSASTNTGAPSRADASFMGPVNPREALHAGEIEGEGEDGNGEEEVCWVAAEEDMGMQRRLTFGHGKAEAAARAAVAAAAAAAPAVVAAVAAAVAAPAGAKVVAADAGGAAVAASPAGTAPAAAVSPAAASPAAITVAGAGRSGEVSRRVLSILILLGNISAGKCRSSQVF